MQQLPDFTPEPLSKIVPPHEGEETFFCPNWPGLLLTICRRGRCHWYYQPQDRAKEVYLGTGSLVDVRRYYQECQRGITPEDVQRTLKQNFRRLFSEWRQDNDLPKGQAVRLAKTVLGELQVPR